MAATLKLRRGTSFTNPSISEPFFNTDSNILQVGYGNTTGEHITLVKIGENTGDVSFIGDISGSNLSLSGNAKIDGNIRLGGSIYLGDGDSTDEIIVNASLSGSLVPDTDGVYDLGSTSFRYNNIHVLSASIENLQVGGSGILSSSQQISDYNVFLEIGGDNVVSGSSQISADQTEGWAVDVKTQLNSNNVVSSSAQITIGDTTGFSTFSSSLKSTDDAQDVRLDNIETFTASLDTTFEEIASSTHTLVSGSSQIDINTTQNFQSFSSSVDNRLDEVESTSSINETNIIELFSTSSNHEDRVINLESTGSDHENRIDLLESFSSSLDNTFVTETELAAATGALETTDSELSGRLDNVENFTSSIDTTIKTKLNLDGVVSGSPQVIEILDSLNSYTSSNDINQGIQDDRLDNIELYTASLDDTFEEKSSLSHTLFSGSSQVNADTITNFDSNVKTKLDLDGVISSSVQITIGDTTGYTDFSASIAVTDEGQNDRLDSIEAYTASVETLYEEISSGTHPLVSGSSQIQINDVTGFTIHSSSVDSRLDSLEGDSHTHSNKAQLDVINQNLSNISNVTFNDITASGNVIVSGDLTVLGTATEIQTSELVIKDKLITIASGSTNSAEADGSGIEIDGAGKSIIWDDATQSFILNAKVSSSVGFKGDGSELENVTASDVEYLNVLNKPTLFSGSSQVDYPSISNIPSGIVSGSSQVNADSIVNFDSNVKDKLNSDLVVSGSSGDQLTASLDSRYLEINGDGVFSGSSQVNADSIVNFDSNVKDKMNLDSVISGSSQILDGSGILSSSNENFTTFSSSVDTRLGEIETTFSSSVDSRLDFIEGDFSSSVDSRLIAQEAFSESLDNEFLNTNGDNVVSGSTGEQLTASLDLRYEGIASSTNTLVTGSSQIDVTQTTNIETLATTGSNIFNGNQTITGSLSTSGSISFEGIPWPNVGSESHIIKTQPYTLNLESGSRTFEYAGIALEHFEDAPDSYHNSILLYSYDNHDTPNYGTELNVGPLRNHMRVYPSSSFVGIDEAHMANISIADKQDGTTNALIYADDIQIGGFNGDTISIGNSTSNNSILGLNTIISSPITSSETIEASFFYGDGSQLENVVASEITYENITGLPSGIVSGAAQIDVTLTQNYGSIRQYDDSDNKLYLDSETVVSSSLYSSPSQGTLRATINGINSDVDLGLIPTDSPSFAGISLLSVAELPLESDQYTALFLSSSDEVVSRTLGNAAFYMVSNSLDISLDTGSFNDSVLLTAGAVKTYVNEYIKIVGSADITSVTAGDGISGGAESGDAIITLNTGSLHFINGVAGIAPTLPENLVSSSEQISFDGIIDKPSLVSGSSGDQLTASLDSRYVNSTGDENIGGTKTFTNDVVISGDLTVNGTRTTINTTNLNVQDNIIELNYGGSATNGGILVKDVTASPTTLSGSLLWDGANDYWIAGPLGSENRILTTADNVVTDGNIDTKIKLKLDSDNVHSGSYLGTATTSDLTEGTNLYYTNELVKLKLDLDGVVSGSVLRNLDGTGILSSSNENFTDFSSSVDSRFDALSTDYNDLQNVPSGIVSSSEQISNYNTFLEINGDGVISGSSQVQIDSVTGFTSFSSSVDGRIDLLESFSSSLDAGFVTETELNTATQSLVDLIDTKLNTGSYNTDSSSFDNRIDLLESFSSSLDAGFVTEEELNTATQSLVDSIGTKLNTGSYNTDSQSFDSRLDSLEGVTSENPLTFTDTTTIDFTRVGDVITADVIGGVVSGSSQIDVTQTSNIETLATTGSNTFSGINTFNSNINVGGTIGLVGASIATSAGSLGLTATNGISLLTAGGGDGVVISTNGNTTIYGALALQDIGVAGTSTSALVVGGGNVVSQRTLGSNAFNSNAYEEQASSTHTLVSGSSQITSVTGTIVPTTSIIPDANIAYDLGSPTNRFRDLYLSNNTIDFPSGSFGFGNDGFGFKDPFGDPAAFVASELKIADPTSGDIISLQIVNGQLETTATDSEGAPIDPPSSNLSGSFTGSFNGTLLSTNGVISGSDQLTGSLVDLDSTQTISGTKTFNDIVVNGTGSFAYFVSTESQLNTIGQSFIVLNNDTPTQRYAGLAVYDSGSAGVTASLEFDGQTNDWFYEYSDDNGVTTDHGAVLFGPAYNTKGTPTYPTNNTIQKGNGGHHLLDSNITDNGSTITLGSNVQVNGNISITGTVDGIDLQIFSSSVDSRIDTLEGVTSENPLTFTDTTTIDFTRVGNVITAKAIGGIVSGSSQIDYNSIQNKPSIPSVPTNISAFTNDVGYSTYSSNQATSTNSDVVFNSVSATNDIIAYASSDRRLKDNILPISNPLQKINSIGGYSFEWNVEKQHIYSGKDYGVIAQEIEEILPELVDTRENGYKAVKYDKLVSLLIEGIKELSTEVEQLKQQINK